MKLYSSYGPNPKAARMALAEKGLDYERVEVNLVRGENRDEAYRTRVNPAGTLPTLETDEGQMISEVGAIAEYLEEVAPTPSLFGTTPEERAQTRMWARRLDLDVCIMMGIGFQTGAMREFFAPRKTLAREECAEDFVAIAHERLEWLEGQMTGDWVCGDRFSWADIPTFCYLEWFQKRGRQTAPTGGWLDGWRERMRARPSAKA